MARRGKPISRAFCARGFRISFSTAGSQACCAEADQRQCLARRHCDLRPVGSQNPQGCLGLRRLRVACALEGEAGRKPRLVDPHLARADEKRLRSRDHARPRRGLHLRRVRAVRSHRPDDQQATQWRGGRPPQQRLCEPVLRRRLCRRRQLVRRRSEVGRLHVGAGRCQLGCRWSSVLSQLNLNILGESGNPARLATEISLISLILCIFEIRGIFILYTGIEFLVMSRLLA